MLAPTPDPETRAKVAEEEKRDFELTTTYKGRPVRVEHNGVAVNGTVRVVKYDMLYILWSDGSQSSLKEAIAAALKAAKAREQRAQTVDAPPPLTLTPPSTPRRAHSSPRGGAGDGRLAGVGATPPVCGCTACRGPWRHPGVGRW